MTSSGPHPEAEQNDCPQDATLWAAIEDRLDVDTHRRICEHLNSCSTCQARVESLSGAEEILPEGAAEGSTASSEDSSLKAVMDDLRVGNPRTSHNEASGVSESWENLIAAAADGSNSRMFGCYEVIERVGRGGMGVVLKCRDASLDRIVAIKLMHPELAVADSARARFTREAKAAAAVNHEHVVTIHAVDEHDNYPYLVMEYIKGRSLRQLIDDGPIPIPDVLRIGAQIARGLAAAHQQGLIHRDIKPANILLENGVARVKVTDFGLAKAIDDATLTHSGVIAGTPQYMAPEQAEQANIDHRADLFSLGSVLYEMCTGQPAFPGDSAIRVIRQVCDTRPRPIADLNPEVPTKLQKVVNRLMEKRPSQRIQTATEVADALESQLFAVQAGKRVKRTGSQLVLPWIGVVVVAVTLFVASGNFGRLRTKSWPFFSPMVAGSHDSSADSASDGAFQIEGQRFDSLQAAVTAAKPNETITIHENGPFVVDPISLGDKPLTIRAAPGVAPELNTKTDVGELLRSDTRLELEGLRLRAYGEESRSIIRVSNLAVIQCRTGPLVVKRCEISSGLGNGGIWFDGEQISIDGCFVSSPDTYGLHTRLRADSKLDIENSVFHAHTAILVRLEDVFSSGKGYAIQANQSTFVGRRFVSYVRDPSRRKQRIVATIPKDTTALSVQTQRSLFHVELLYYCHAGGVNSGDSPERFRVNVLSRHLAWRERNNFHVTPFETAKFTSFKIERDFFDDDESREKWLSFIDHGDSPPRTGSVEFASSQLDQYQSFRVVSTDPSLPDGFQVGAVILPVE